MKEIVILSGKGGTGKTAVTASFAALAEGAVLADADVDAANLALVLSSRIIEEEPFESMPKPVLDEEDCIFCGCCAESCRFHAIGVPMSIDLTACEGCGLCVEVCPTRALHLEPSVAGCLRVSATTRGTLVHAHLDPGEENSGKLVTKVRTRARAVAQDENAAWLLVDGPPGIGCPVIAALGGADLAVLVAEPSLAGMHDMERALGLAEHFGVPAAVVVNKWDLAPENTERIRSGCEERGIPWLGRIPFDRSVVDAIVAGQPPVLAASEEVAKALRAVWDRVVEETDAKEPATA